MTEAVALGFRAHSGWAVVTAVAGSPASPVILNRCRIVTADTAIPGSKQPYHAAMGLDLTTADEFIRHCLESSTGLAMGTVNALVAQLKRDSRSVLQAGILIGSGRALPDLAATLRSHALIHTAEGEFFRGVLVRASERCHVPITKIKEREVWDRGATLFRTGAADLQTQIDEIGRSIGPPWRQDEKLASLAAWIALTEARHLTKPA